MKAFLHKQLSYVSGPTAVPMCLVCPQIRSVHIPIHCTLQPESRCHLLRQQQLITDCSSIDTRCVTYRQSWIHILEIFRGDACIVHFSLGPAARIVSPVPLYRDALYDYIKVGVLARVGLQHLRVAFVHVALRPVCSVCLRCFVLYGSSPTRLRVVPTRCVDRSAQRHYLTRILQRAVRCRHRQALRESVLHLCKPAVPCTRRIRIDCRSLRFVPSS